MGVFGTTPARQYLSATAAAPAAAPPHPLPSSKATTVTTAKKASAAAKNPPATGAGGATERLLATLAVKPGEDAWTQSELQEVVDELHVQREHAVAMLTEQEAGLNGLMRDSGDGAGQDQADVGATTFERDHELTVVNIERDKLAQIDRALARIDDGTYGVCESCGEPIGKLRVMAFPRATLCMTCKQREERR